MARRSTGHFGDDYEEDFEEPDEADFGDPDDDDDETRPCPRCGKAVWEQIDRCPHCGIWISTYRPDRIPSNRRTFYILGIIALGMILAYIVYRILTDAEWAVHGSS